jgi:ankyrin repeat protein
MFASIFGNIYVIKELLDSGADMDININGITVLQCAIEGNHKDVASLLQYTQEKMKKN